MTLHNLDSPKPFLWRIRSSRFFIYTVINLAVFTDAYLYGLIIPVLPFALTERVNLHESEVQRWIGILLAAYGAGLVVGSPIAGWYADKGDSRRGPYLWGLVALAVSTIAFSMGRTTPILFVGRLIQGASSAIVHTVGMAILADTVGQAGIGPAMGFVTMNIALGVVLGPMLGGIIYHRHGYLAVFVSGYGIIGLDFLLRVLMIIDLNTTAEKRSIQNKDRTYGTTTTEGVSESPPDEHDMPTSLSSSATSSSTLLSEHQKLSSKQPIARRHPILELLSTPRMLAAILGDFMQSLILTGLESILPLRIKTMFHYNSMQVAFVFLALSFPSFAGPAIGHISDRVGAKVMVCFGFITVAPLLILLRLVDHTSAQQVALLCVVLLALGIALNMILTPVFSEAMYVVDEKEEKQPGIFGEKGAYAQAFGLMNVAYATGSLVGPLGSGFLVGKVGWNDLTLGTGILSALCVLPCLCATGGRRFKQQSLEREGR